MTAVRMDGKELAARVREDVAREVAELGHVGLATVLVGDDPASHVYIAAKHKAAHRGGHRRARRAAPGRHERGGGARARRPSSTTTPRSTGSSCSCRCPPHMDETKVTYAVAPAKDVDGFHPVNAGNLYLGTPIHVPATPSGCMELLRAYEHRPGGQGGGRDRPQRDRRPADGDAADARERDRHGLPLAHRRPRRARAPRRHRRRRRRPAGDRHGRDGQARRGRARRRADAHGRGDQGRHRRLRGGGRGLPDADARGHRADDDRDAARRAR